MMTEWQKFIMYNLHFLNIDKWQVDMDMTIIFLQVMTELCPHIPV